MVRAPRRPGAAATAAGWRGARGRAPRCRPARRTASRFSASVVLRVNTTRSSSRRADVAGDAHAGVVDERGRWPATDTRSRGARSRSTGAPGPTCSTTAQSAGADAATSRFTCAHACRSAQHRHHEARVGEDGQRTRVRRRRPPRARSRPSSPARTASAGRSRSRDTPRLGWRRTYGGRMPPQPSGGRTVSRRATQGHDRSRTRRRVAQRSRRSPWRCHARRTRERSRGARGRGGRAASRPRTPTGTRRAAAARAPPARANASNCAGCTAESTLNPSTAPDSPHAANSRGDLGGGADDDRGVDGCRDHEVPKRRRPLAGRCAAGALGDDLDEHLSGVGERGRERRRHARDRARAR